MKTAGKVIKILALCGAACLVLYVAFVVLMLHIFSYKGYHKEHQDLYAVAVNNIFGVSGHLSNGEVSYSPEIHVIETDDYGRTLFFYSEYCCPSPDPQYDYGMAFVIMQSSKDGYAYYYPDKCYIPYFDTTSDWGTIAAELDAGYFDSFKKENNWNLEPVEEQCAKVKISGKKPEGKLRPKDQQLDKIIYPYEVKNGYNGSDKSFCKYSIFCEADRYGKELHYVYGMTKNTARNGQNIYDSYEYAIILNADGTCSGSGIIKIQSPEDSIEAIRELKLSNKWNQSD